MQADSVERQTLEQRFLEMEALGLITPSSRKPGEKPNFQPGEPKPGALKRFLEEREYKRKRDVAAALGFET